MSYQCVKNFMFGYSEEVVVISYTFGWNRAEVDKPANWPTHRRGGGVSVHFLAHIINRCSFVHFSLRSKSPVELILHLAGSTKTQEVGSRLLTNRARWCGHGRDVENKVCIHTSAIRTHRFTISKSISIALNASLQVFQMSYNKTLNLVQQFFGFLRFLKTEVSCRLAT